MRSFERCLLLVAALAPGLVRAQVAVDRGALEQLSPTAPATPSAPAPSHIPHKPITPKPITLRPPTFKPVAPPAKPAAKPGRPARPVSIAPAPPPPAALPVVPPAPTPPAALPAIPMQPDAPGAATRIIGGLRVTFGHDVADLNPTTVAALRSVARTVGAEPNASLNVYAYADGPPDDPSTPRRLSLSRALAVRAVLMSEGIVSTRIYVRALGATTLPGAADGPPDRVDVTQVGIAPAH